VALAYMAGLSYREIAYVLRLVEARTWVQKLRTLPFRVGRRARRMVAVDKTVLKMAGRRVLKACRNKPLILVDEGLRYKRLTGLV